tara:strand:+ start:101868 stop:102209 length:342 start_codon:yes stop_codon:yes gene_type:complete
MIVSPAYAQAAAAAPSAGGMGTTAMIIQFALLGLVFWLFIIRPQSKRMKEHKARIAAVKKGDQIVTGGGLVGKITKVEDAFVEVELAPNVKVRVVKSTLSDVVDPTLAKPAND